MHKTQNQSFFKHIMMCSICTTVAILSIPFLFIWGVIGQIVIYFKQIQANKQKLLPSPAENGKVNSPSPKHNNSMIDVA